MLRYLTQAEFHNHPKLIDTMFKHRAEQFKGRLDWDVTVDHMGYERDQYDTPEALYGIWEMPDGSHGASMRMLTTTGPVMVNDYFQDISGCHFQSAQIWESTRFCMSPDIKSNQHQLSAAIMLSGCEVGMNFHVTACCRELEAQSRQHPCPEQALGFSKCMPVAQAQAHSILA